VCSLRCVHQAALSAADKAVTRIEALIASTIDRHTAVLHARDDAKTDIVDMSGRISAIYARADSLGIPLPGLHDVTRVITARLTAQGLTDTPRLSQLGGEFASYGRVGSAVATAIQSLEAAKSVLLTTSLARYSIAIEKAKQDLAAAEALFGSEVALKECLREQVATAHNRLQKCKADLEEGRELLVNAGITADPLIEDVVAKAKATLNKGVLVMCA
jgi:hypothetical protein